MAALKTSNDEFRKQAEARFRQERAQADERFQRQRELAAQDLEARRTAVDDLVKPLGENLTRLDRKVAELERARAGGEPRLEYETLYALGPLYGIEESNIVLRTARLCHRYGSDAISTGGPLAWTMECTQRGLGLDATRTGLTFGRANAVQHTIPDIAERRGLGAMLAEGSRRAAARLGTMAQRLAVYVKGMELPGYEPRSLKTMTLGLAVSPRGACHNRSDAYEVDFSGRVDLLRAAGGRVRRLHRGVGLTDCV